MKEQKTYIITGKQGEGKTNKVIDLIRKLEEKGLNIFGFVAPGYWSANLRTGFDLLDISSGRRKVLCRSEFSEDDLKIGRFYFKPDTIKYGERLIERIDYQKADLVVIDEIGRFELDDKLWANLFRNIVERVNVNLLITVRDIHLEAVILKFKILQPVIFQINIPAEKIAERLLLEKSGKTN